MTVGSSFPSRLFLLLSLFILLTDAAFVAINWYSADKTLATTLHKQSEHLKDSFEVSIAQVYEHMLQLASLVSSNPRVQELFLAGKKAVEAEGGGAGGTQAAHYRKALYQELAPSWGSLMQEYDTRQLHFHLGPGSLSFLRVHRPERFGDRMDAIRHIIVDTNTYQRSNIGFETDRIYSGLRAVVPVFAHDTERGEKVFVGALETGTAFTTIIHSLENITAAETLVLLKQSHVKKNMWETFVQQELEMLDTPCKCYIEAASSQRALNIFLVSENRLNYRNDGLHTNRAYYQGKTYSVTRFPLFDYNAKQSPNGEPVGSIAILTDISTQVENNHDQLRINLVYAVLGFIVIEILLYFGLRIGSRRLNDIITAQTAELTELKEHFEQQATMDSLTQLHNRRYFVDRLEDEMERTRRTQLPLSLIMLDLDFFKSFNDTFGHRVGDQILTETARLILQVSRTGDIPARYGGEEFCLLLPNTDLAGANHIAQRLLEAFRDGSIVSNEGQKLSWTASFGVAQWDGLEALSDFIERGDMALYRAKKFGRDRIDLAEPTPNDDET